MLRYPRLSRLQAAVLAVCCAAAACVAVGAAAAQGSPAPPVAWGVAQRIPDLDATEAAQYPGGGVDVNAVSCTAPGDCAAAGDLYGEDFNDGAREAGWVASETNGVWQQPTVVALGDLSEFAKYTLVDAVSCASPGNCVAGGHDATEMEPTGFIDTFGAFVISEVNGAWGAPEEVPGTDALNQGAYAKVTSVSCPAPGDCAVTGLVDNSSEFVDDQTGGTWATARLVPGYMASGSPIEYPTFPGTIPVISCAKPGECVVAGNDVRSGKQVTSVATETGGTWGSSAQLPGIAAAGGGVTSLSCTAVGDCTAGGWTFTGKNQVPFVADESGGTWTSREIPGYAALTSYAATAGPVVTAVSCSAPGDCAAGGGYQASATQSGVFLASEVNGTWKAAAKVAGTPTVQRLGGQFRISVPSISCAGAGNCSALIQNTRTAASFIADETGGAWGPARPIAGVTGGTVVSAVSCSAPGACLVTGSDHGGADGFVVARSSAAATLTTFALSAAKVTYGAEQAEKVTATVRATWPTAPSGKVAVTAGGVTLCTITLVSGHGSCALPPAHFARGTASLTARYGGAPGFAPSSTNAKSFTVVKAASATRLTLSAASVPYGKEQREKLTVKVAPQHAGRPSGTVTIRFGSVTACTITLSHAGGSCTLTAKRFRPGTYHVAAAYHGDANFNGSAASKTVTITG